MKLLEVLKMKSRIRLLRERKRMSQLMLGREIGVSQQIISRIENDISTLSIDLLVNLVNYFNVTTDYILGISDLKRGLEGQLKENKLLDKYEDIIFFIEKLNDRDKKLMLVICQSMLRLDEGNNYD